MADAILKILADELDLAQQQIEALGVALCADSAVVEAHLPHLQLLDQAGQRCASIADILRSPDIRSATRNAPLESIARRLHAQS